MADIEKFVYYSNGSKKVLKPTDRIVIGSGGLAFEGDTANDFELQLTVTDPTDDRTINFPDEDGDIALLQSDALPKALSFPVKNPSTTTALTKGQLVYISGHSGNKPEVSLAQSNSSATMPAFGFVQSDIAAEAEGYVVYSGLFKGIDTNALYSEGDTLYVSSTTAGGFQNTPPTGSNLIQNIGKIVKSDASNGEVLVGGAGRTNATPNLNEGKFFIGNASNQSVQSAYKLPTTDGTSGQVLTTNGSGVLSFSDVSGGISNLVEDTTPQLGGTLDLNSQAIQGNLIPSAVDTYSLGSTAAEWSDLYLGDSSRIYFGNDQDVFLEHDPDAGLILDMSLDPALTPRLTIKNANTGIATGGEIEFVSETSSPSANDIIGSISATANNSVSTLHEYTSIRSKITNSNNNVEAAGLYFYTAAAGLPAGNASTEGLSIEGDNVGSVKVDLPLHDGVNSGLTLGGTLVKSTAAELNVLDVSTESPSDNDVLTYTTASGLHWTPSSVDLTSVSSSIAPSAADTYNLGSSNSEWANLYLGDSSYIYFGNDQDVRLQHIPDSGLTLSMGSSQAAYDPTFTIQSSTSNTNGIGPQIKLQKMYTDPGDIVGDIYFQGYYSAAYDVYGRIKVRAPAQTHGNLQLSVLSGDVETVAIDIIGDSASSTTEIVNAGPIATKVTASDPTVRGDHAHIYSKDVGGSAEMFVQDEAGNVTQISPHNEEGDWVYWSENKKTGKKVKVNMEKMIKRLEEITGESFFEEYVEGT